MKRHAILLPLSLTLLCLLAACSGATTVPITADGLEQAAPTTAADAVNPAEGSETGASAATEEEVARPEGWTEATHSNDVDPNYEVVFPPGKVNQITITIDPANWEAMQADMNNLLGEPGAGRGMGPGGGQPPTGDFTPPEGIEPPTGDLATPEGGMQPPTGERPTPPAGMEPPTGEFAPSEGVEPPAGGFGPGGGSPGMGGNTDMVDGTPIWVPATIEFEGNTWTNVGVRYKGNSSLTSAWNSGSLKMPFKLDFDEFEDDYPEIDNQRFFGFQQLSLANGFSDTTYLRETVTYDLMREAGLTASRTAFYEVILDYGEGPVSLGIYTVVEVIDDTVIETAYGDDSGNIYEADGAGVTLAEGTLEQIADSFEKENNKDEADWSDIEALYTALHAETRATDPAQWRADLEAVFDVDTFLNWLAVSAVVQNWDTYGAMTHNYYLYNNPETGQLVWLPWDHNMTLGSGGGGGRGGMMGGRGATSFDRAEVTEQWPLIRFLLDDPTYNEQYVAYLAATSERFDAAALSTRINEMAELLRPVITAAGEAAQFDTAVEQLLTVVAERDAAVADFLATQ